MPAALRNLIAAKERRGHVHWLKPDTLGRPDVDVVGDFEGASRWLKALGYRGLILSRAWWMSQFQGGFFLTRGGGTLVASNFEKGLHDYDAVMQLVASSDERLRPVLNWIM